MFNLEHQCWNVHFSIVSNTVMQAIYLFTLNYDSVSCRRLADYPLSS